MIAARHATGRMELVVAAAQLFRPTLQDAGGVRAERVEEASAAGAGDSSRARAVLLSLSVQRARTRTCGAGVCGRHRRADPHRDDRRDRRVHGRDDHRLRRVHRSAAGLLREGRRASRESTAGCSSATKCKPPGAAPAITGSAFSTGTSNPDIMVSAKGMGNGAPVAMTIATPEVADKYPGHHLRHVRRQSGLDGGGDVDASKSSKRKTCGQNCKTTGAYLGERFAELKEKHQLVGDVRGLGMMQALELVKDRKTKEPDAAGDRARLRRNEETRRADRQRRRLRQRHPHRSDAQRRQSNRSTSWCTALDAGLTAAATT